MSIVDNFICLTYVLLQVIGKGRRWKEHNSVEEREGEGERGKGRKSRASLTEFWLELWAKLKCSF